MKKDKKNKKHLTLPVNFELSSVSKINPIISKYIVRVMYKNENRNGVYFKEEVVEEMIKTIGGIPVLGQYSEANKDFLEHGDLVVKTDYETGSSYVVREGVESYGYTDRVSPVYYWAKHEDKDGVTREYLHIEVFLWTGLYDELDRLKLGKNNLSMEVEGIGDYEEIDGKTYFVPNGNSYFTGLCILGETIEPCFEGAGIIPYFSLNEKINSQSEARLKELENALLNFSLENPKDFDLETENIENIENVEEVNPEIEEKLETAENDPNPNSENSGENEPEPIEGENEVILENLPLDSEIVNEVPLETEILPVVEENPTAAEFNLEDYQNLLIEKNELSQKLESALNEINTLKEEMTQKLSIMNKYKKNLKNTEYEEILNNLFSISKDDLLINVLELSFANVEQKIANSNNEENQIEENITIQEDNQYNNFSLYENQLEDWQKEVLKEMNDKKE